MKVSDRTQRPNMQSAQLRRTFDSDITEQYKGLGADYAYAREVAQHFARLENFALKSKSLAVRDAFALCGTVGTLKFEDLKAFIGSAETTISNKLRQHLRKAWKPGALLALARLVANQRSAPADLENASRFFVFIETVWGLNKFTEKDQLIYVETLGELGSYDNQEKLIRRLGLQTLYPVQVELHRLNSIHSRSDALSKPWISKLNKLYTQHGCAKVSVVADDTLAPLDRLRTVNKAKIQGPLVSVIMPTYQGSGSMLHAIKSLLNQSWSNIEIIVVDDHSGRTFDKYLEAAEQLSDKVQVVRHATNLGSYSARNTGLKFASGDFITVLDDDDWAHGDKIATQVQHLLKKPDVPANLSLHGRVTEDLRFVRLNNNMFLAHINYSSLMVRRQTVEDIGGWDTVNRGGDSEFMSRITSFYGVRPVQLGEVPLSLSRTRQGSLTSGELVRGYMDSSRVLYANAFKQWQLKAAKKNRMMLAHPAPNSYPIPSTMGAGRRRLNLGVYDIVFMTDFRMDENIVGEVLAEMRAAKARGLRVGYIHAEAPFARVPSKISPDLFSLQLQGIVEQIGWTDVAEIKLLIIRHHNVCTYLDQMRSNAVVRRALIVAGTVPRIFGGADFADDLGRALANIDRMFSVESFVVPDGEVGALAMGVFVDPARRIQTPWKPMAPNIPDTNGAKPRSRGPVPIVGRHGSAHASQWPASYDEFSKIYLQPGVKTRLPKRDRKDIVKRYPEMDPSLVQFYQPERGNEAAGYLGRIDFWVYFPSECTVHLDDRLVIEAMLHRKLVVLPSRFAGAYGSGPLYVDPIDVVSAINAVWKDRNEFTRRLQDGLAYVRGTEDSFMAIVEENLLLANEKN